MRGAVRTYVSAGFGEPIGKLWLELARKVSGGVRQDIPNGLHAPAVNRLVEEIAKSGLRAIFLLGGWLWGNPEGTNIRTNREQKPTHAEIAATAGQVLSAAENFGLRRVTLEVGPEINIDPIYKKELGGLEENCHAVWQAIHTHAPGTPMIAGSVSNVEKRDGLKHLARWLNYQLPPRWWVGVHPYRTRSRSDEFRGFRSSSEMLVGLGRVLAGRKFAITESGWHDAEQSYRVGPFGLECVPRWLKFFRRTSQFAPVEVAAFAQDDISMWRGAGAELFTWYQIRDGNAYDPDTEAHFGAYRRDRTPKPVAAVLAREIQA